MLNLRHYRFDSAWYRPSGYMQKLPFRFFLWRVYLDSIKQKLEDIMAWLNRGMI